MSTPFRYRFYAFDFSLKTEVDCLLYFDVSSERPDPTVPSLSLDFSAHTAQELAEKADTYFHSEYSVDIDEVSITSFLNTIKAWAVSPASAFAFVHFSVVGK